MRKLIIILAIVFVLLLGAGAAYFFIIAPRMAPPVTNEDGTPASAKPKKTKEPVIVYYPIGSFISNMADSHRIFKVTITLAVIDDKKVDEAKILTEKENELTDYCIDKLRRMAEEEVRSPDAMENLRTSMLEDLRTKFELTFIQTIYFKDFVIN